MDTLFWIGTGLTLGTLFLAAFIFAGMNDSEDEPEEEYWQDEWGDNP